jgi:hypothetical protein
MDKITLTGNYSGKGSDAIEKIIADNNIDMKYFYVYSFKVKQGSWNTAAKKRDQELTWTSEDQVSIVKNAKGKMVSSKRTSPVQIMNGHSKHYPDFMIANNQSNAIEVTFMRRPIESDILESFKEIIKDMPVRRVMSKRKIYDTGVAGEMTTFDAHIAKLAWAIETGYRNYDLKIALKDYKYANDENLELMAPHKPEKIFYILGQDMYHMDNMAGHTTGGDHTLDVDGRITKVHPMAFAITISNIENCAKLANVVEVIWIPGNHDFLSSYMLAFAVAQYFRNCPNITVDVSQNPRKARLWGTLLVGWTHRIVGKHTVWSNELAQQFPELWGKSYFREWHHGDQHKKMDVKVTPIFTSGGVICRQITALSPVDKWHTDNVFTDAVPGGESFLWSKDNGIFANFVAWTGQYEKNRNKIVKE